MTTPTLEQKIEAEFDKWFEETSDLYHQEDEPGIGSEQRAGRMRENTWKIQGIL